MYPLHLRLPNLLNFVENMRSYNKMNEEQNIFIYLQRESDAVRM